MQQVAQQAQQAAQEAAQQAAQQAQQAGESPQQVEEAAEEAAQQECECFPPTWPQQHCIQIKETTVKIAAEIYPYEDEDAEEFFQRFFQGLLEPIASDPSFLPTINHLVDFQEQTLDYVLCFCYRQE